jgi:hypothetical protein
MNSLSDDEKSHLVAMQLASLEIAKATPSSDYDVVTFKYFQDEMKIVSDAATASVTALIDGAPSSLDTLKEIATSLGDNSNLSSALLASIGNVQAAVTAEAATRAAADTESDGKINYLRIRSENLQTNLDGDIQNLADEITLRDEQYQSVVSDIANESAARIDQDGAISLRIDDVEFTLGETLTSNANFAQAATEAVASELRSAVETRIETTNFLQEGLDSLGTNKFDQSDAHYSKRDDGAFQVDSYLYIGPLWRIAANNSSATAKKLVFEHLDSASQTWKVGVPFIRG